MPEVHREVFGPLKTNVYVVCKRDRCLLVDAAPGSMEILRWLEELGVGVEAILITHGHFDHVGSARALRDALGVRVYMHAAEQVTLELSRRRAYDAYGLFVEWEEPIVDCWLEGGEELEVAGMKVRVLHTPGHTPGSVCYLVEDELLFSGDTLFKGTVGRTDFPESSPEDMERSLALLASLPDHLTVYPGHGEPTTLGREKRENPFLSRYAKGVREGG